MAKKWTPSKAKRTYDTFRRRYFLDGHERVPPVAKDLRWTWLPEKSSTLGETVWDEDDQVVDLALNVALLFWPDMLKITMLHEMTHIRLGPNIKCPSMIKNRRAQPLWTREMTRLAALGAPLL